MKSNYFFINSESNKLNYSYANKSSLPSAHQRTTFMFYIIISTWLNGSMKKVYLICPSLNLNSSINERQKNYKIVQKPPTGLLYLASNLKRHNVDSVIIDQNVNRISFETIVQMVKNEDPLFIGIYSDFYLKANAIKLANLIKCEMPEKKVVIGGPASCEYQLFHEHNIDIVCHGEGDQVICELVDYCLGKIELEDIKGISFLKNSKVVKNQNRPLIQDLDSIPFPSFDKIDINAYYDYHIFGMKRPFFTLIASRGCPNRCTYCSSHEFWQNKYRFRSVKNVVDEIDTLVNRYGIRYLAFNDDIFGYKTDWLYEFINEIKRRKIKVVFYCLFSPSSLRKDRWYLLSLLKSIGLDIIVIGLQSVDPGVLRNINRHQSDPEELSELIRLSKKLGITTAIHFIYGLPGDSTDIFQKNLDYALRVKPHYALFYMLEKMPGSEIYKNYSDKPVTNLPDETIMNWVNYSQSRFFKDPRIIFQNVVHILFKNPSWFLIGLRNLLTLSHSITKSYHKSDLSVITNKEVNH
jgi:radical SAM superfamily enzyme YgiQ (UPF0313 family)